nr:MAG TPA: hypothetical protein [Caudoviricetes sp.]
MPAFSSSLNSSSAIIFASLRVMIGCFIRIQHRSLSHRHTY